MLAVLVGLGAWAYQALRKPPPPPQLETVVVDRGRVAARVTATGTLSARVTVQVSSQLSGRVSRVLADFNDHVKKGQVLARINQALLRADSVTPARGAVFDVLEAALAPIGFTIDRVVTGDAPDGPVENLIALRDGTGAHLAFAGHVDVGRPTPTHHRPSRARCPTPMLATTTPVTAIIPGVIGSPSNTADQQNVRGACASWSWLMRATPPCARPR